MPILKYVYPEMKSVYAHYKGKPKSSDSVTIHAVVEEPLVEGWLAEVGEVPWKLIVKDCEEYHFDCGGAVLKSESYTELELNAGWKLTVFVRHLAELETMSGRVQNHLQNLGPHIWLPGHWVKAVLTVETGKEIKEAVKRERELRKEEIDGLWSDHRKIMKKAGVVVPPVKG